ncbi:hypothetical protein D1007_59760 [Hordeum vulgare]|nr:hypothetical protein D1007_59760 [Hordeum vulgare]
MNSGANRLCSGSSAILVSCPDSRAHEWNALQKLSPASDSIDCSAGLDEAVEDDEGGEADVMDVIDAEITVPNITLPEEITSWSRNDDEGSSVDDDDEAYANDGHIAPVGEEELDDDEGFFV